MGGMGQPVDRGGEPARHRPARLPGCYPGRGPVALGQARTAQVTAGFSPGQQGQPTIEPESLLDALCYVTFWELATRVSHRLLSPTPASRWRRHARTAQMADLRARGFHQGRCTTARRACGVHRQHRFRSGEVHRIQDPLLERAAREAQRATDRAAAVVAVDALLGVSLKKRQDPLAAHPGGVRFWP
jgi:hypothetical protein